MITEADGITIEFELVAFKLHQSTTDVGGSAVGKLTTNDDTRFRYTMKTEVRCVVLDSEKTPLDVATARLSVNKNEPVLASKLTAYVDKRLTFSALFAKATTPPCSTALFDGQ